MSTLFSPCAVCEWLHESKPTHVVRETFDVIVIPEDDEHEMTGMPVCREHFLDYQRAKYGQPQSGLSGGIQ